MNAIEMLEKLCSYNRKCTRREATFYAVVMIGRGSKIKPVFLIRNSFTRNSDEKKNTINRFICIISSKSFFKVTGLKLY